MLQRPSQSPYLNLIELLLLELESCAQMHASKPQWTEATVVKKSGLKILHNNVRSLGSLSQDNYWKLLLEKLLLQATDS